MLTDDVVRALQLEALGGGQFRGGHADMGHGTVTGGQLLSQALIAAGLQHADKRPKTIHTVFARAATVDVPIEIQADTIQSGRTFASVNVTMRQNGRVCAQSLVLLAAVEPDFIHHADAAPEVAPPSEVLDNGLWQVRIEDGVDVSDPDAVGPPDLDVWVRFAGAPIDPAIDQALLAFSTDFFLVGTAMRPHPGVGQSQAHKTLSTGVITHTLTFHEPASAADWTLMRHHSAFAGGGRSYGRADVFRTDGTLVASFVQDAMIRPMSPASGRL